MRVTKDELIEAIATLDKREVHGIGNGCGCCAYVVCIFCGKEDESYAAEIQHTKDCVYMRAVSQYENQKD